MPTFSAVPEHTSRALSSMAIVVVAALLATAGTAHAVVSTGPAAAGTVAEFSTAGISPFSTPVAITAGHDGNLWFADSSVDSIGRITPSGAIAWFSAGITPGGHPTGIAAGPDGNVWFTEMHGDRIGRMTPSGTVNEFSTGVTPGSGPDGITAGPDGNLWFTEAIGDRIGRITPSGTVTEFSTGISIGTGGRPTAIAAGPDGNLWFTEFDGNRIGRITPSGTVTTFRAGISSNNEPAGIAAGPDGNLWFTEFAVDRIGRITTAGVVTEFATGITPRSGPSGIAAGPDGNLWFTESGADPFNDVLGHQIGRITPSGTVTEFAAGTSMVGAPRGIVAGPDGNLWFTEANAARIGRMATGAGPYPPKVRSVRRNDGPLSGGTLVTLRGSNFFNITDVRFGSRSASGFVVRSPTELVATVPAASGGRPGRVAVTAINGVGSAPGTGSFAYKAEHIVLEAMNVEVAAVRTLHDQVALFTYRVPGGEAPLASGFHAQIRWGDGRRSDATIQRLRTRGHRMRLPLYAVVGTHRYGRHGTFHARVSVGRDEELTRRVTSRVTVLPLDPTAAFVINPTDPTEGDLALLMPVDVSPVQRDIVSYKWTFSDGTPAVVDTPATAKDYMTLLRSLAADPANDTLRSVALGAGILPVGSSMGDDVVRQIVGIWLEYLPRHLVPHIFTSTGQQRVTLSVTDTAAKTSAGFVQTAEVSDHCNEWGGPLAGLFGHATTCDTWAGFHAWMNGPSRRPDYYSFGISGSRYGVSINVAHGGQVFVSLEADAGSPKPAPALPPGAANGSVSVAEGFVGPPSGAPPPDAYIARYLEGPSLDVALLLGPFGSNMSLSPGCGCPVSPQAGFEWGIDASAAQWLSSSVGGGVSCGIPVGTLPTLSELGPSDTGPWPHGGGASPSTVPAQKEADPLISRFVDAINDCMPHAAP